MGTTVEMLLLHHLEVSSSVCVEVEWGGEVTCLICLVPVGNISIHLN